MFAHLYGCVTHGVWKWTVTRKILILGFRTMDQSMLIHCPDIRVVFCPAAGTLYLLSYLCTLVCFSMNVSTVPGLRGSSRWPRLLPLLSSSCIIMLMLTQVGTHICKSSRCTIQIVVPQPVSFFILRIYFYSC